MTKCTCDPVPMTCNGEGPSEACEIHGRPYAEWVERGDILNARLEAVKAVIAKVRRTPVANDPYRVALDIADDLEAAVYLEPGTWPPSHGRVIDAALTVAEAAEAQSATFVEQRIADLRAALAAPIGPPPEPVECCASGRCEVCSPGFDWGRDA